MDDLFDTARGFSLMGSPTVRVSFSVWMYTCKTPDSTKRVPGQIWAFFFITTELSLEFLNSTTCSRICSQRSSASHQVWQAREMTYHSQPVLQSLLADLWEKTTCISFQLTRYSRKNILFCTSVIIVYLEGFGYQCWTMLEGLQVSKWKIHLWSMPRWRETRNKTAASELTFLSRDTSLLSLHSAWEQSEPLHSAGHIFK